MAAVLIVLGVAAVLVGSYLLADWPAVWLAGGIIALGFGVDEARR